MPPSGRGRYSAIERTVGLVADLIAGRPLDAKCAAKKLGVGLAAAARQLRAIESLPGVARNREGKAHVWQYVQPASTLGYDKVIAVCFGSSLAPAFEGTSYHEGFKTVRQWLIERSAHRRHFGNIDRKFLVLLQGGDVGLDRVDSPLDEVLDALLKEKKIKVEYERFSGAREVLAAEPLSLLLYHHRLYLVVRLKKGTFRTLRFARVQTVEVLDRFEYPSEAEYSPRTLFSNSYGVFLAPESVAHVRFKLSEKWRVFVRTHRWHVTQESVEQVDGVVVTMRVGRCPELIAFLLGFGEECEVLEPKDLRDQIAASVTRTAALYRASSRPRRELREL